MVKSATLDLDCLIRITALSCTKTQDFMQIDSLLSLCFYINEMGRLKVLVKSTKVFEIIQDL